MSAPHSPTDISIERLANVFFRRRHLLVGLGLVVRLLTSGFYGTQDVEWWKAWGSFAVTHGMVGVYGASDKDMISLREQGLAWSDVWKRTETVIAYDSHDYWRKEYKYVQPPLYIYTLWLATAGFRVFAHDLPNNRWFNLFVNLPPLLASAGLSVVIFWTTRRMAGHKVGVATALGYWCNPNVLIISPIQGYWDPLVALFAVGAVAALYERRICGAFALAACALMFKPQAILIVPVIAVVGLSEHRWSINLSAWGVAALTALGIMSPYILSGHLMGCVAGTLSVVSVSGDGLSIGALNIWWPVQYAIHALREAAPQLGLWHALLGGHFNWEQQVSVTGFNRAMGVDIGLLTLVVYGLFTAMNLYRTSQLIKHNRSVMFRACALQVYAYFILRVEVHENHYFLLIPMLGMTAFLSCKTACAYWFASIIFSIQQLLFYGLGRDFNHGIGVLKSLQAGWTTNVVATANVALFLWICWEHCYGPLCQDQ